MRYSTLFALILLLPQTATRGQTTTSDSQALQALLVEVRQLRQDLRTANVAAQRAQILVYRLNTQEAAVARASQRLDDVRARLARIDDDQRQNEEQVKIYENMREHVDNPSERKQLDDAIALMRTRTDGPSPQTQELHSKEIELEEELRIEQARLSSLQDRLDRLDKALEGSSRQDSKE